MATEGVRQLLQELKDAKKEVHQKDVEDLMQSFVQLGATSFAALKSLWVLRRFSFIFEGRPPQVPGPEFMQNLYAAALGGLSPGSPLRQRCASIYMLYALYFAQPFRPRALIYLGLDKLRELQVTAAECQVAEGGEDTLAVLRALHEERAFLFGAFSADPPTIAKFVTQRLTDAGRAIKVMNSRLVSRLPVESLAKEALPLQEATAAAAKYARALAAVEEMGGHEAARLMDLEPVLPAVMELARDFDTRRGKLLAEMQQRAGTSAQEPLIVALECLVKTGLRRTSATMSKKKKQKVAGEEAAEGAEEALAQLEGPREASEGEEGSDLASDEKMLAAELEAGMLEEASVSGIDDDRGVAGRPGGKSEDGSGASDDGGGTSSDDTFAAELEAGMLEVASASRREGADDGDVREGAMPGGGLDTRDEVGASTHAEVEYGASTHLEGRRGPQVGNDERALDSGQLNGGFHDQAGASGQDETWTLSPGQVEGSAQRGQNSGAKGAKSAELGSHQEGVEVEGGESPDRGVGMGDHFNEETQSDEFEYLDGDTDDDEVSD